MLEFRLYRCLAITRQRPKSGFTLVELLVVISIIGVMVALLLPAVQYTREAARRMHCSNNVRNQLLALHQFHDAYRRFPTGQYKTDVAEYSWCLDVLPYLEQGALADRFDRQKPWDDPVVNRAAAETILPVFRCPSSQIRFEGDIDYGGITGSALTSATIAQGVNSGVLIKLEIPISPIDMGQIKDGTSQTICIAESPDRLTVGGLWISGYNCFSQDNGVIGTTDGGEIYSLHGSGAYVGFADGGTRYLTRHVDQYIVGAICTRDHGEVIDLSPF